MRYKNILIPSLILAVTALSACRSTTKLTSDIEGTWTSVPETVRNNDTMQVSMIKTFAFMPTEGDQGEVIISAMVSIDAPVPAMPELHVVSPISISGSAVASVTGTFRAVSHDEVELTLDASTYSFKLNPEGISSDYDIFTEQATPDAISLPRYYADRFTDLIGPVIRDNMLDIKKIKSIKFTDSMMQCDINGVSLTLRNQSPI